MKGWHLRHAASRRAKDSIVHIQVPQPLKVQIRCVSNSTLVYMPADFEFKLKRCHTAFECSLLAAHIPYD